MENEKTQAKQEKLKCEAELERQYEAEEEYFNAQMEEYESEVCKNE